MKKPVSKLIPLTLPFILLIMWSFTDGKLSNSEAEKQIKNSYPRYLTSTIQLNDNSLSPRIPNELELLSENELANYTFIPPGKSGYGCYGVLSEEAKQYLVRVINNEFIEMAIAKVSIDRITGIREIPALNVSEVEYIERIVEVTPIGAILHDVSIGQTYNVTATFNKYNDGWRIANLSTRAQKITISNNHAKANDWQAIYTDKNIKGLNDSNYDPFNRQLYQTIQIKCDVDSLSYAFGIVNYNSLRNENLNLNPMIIASSMIDVEKGKDMMSDEVARRVIMKFTNKSETGIVLKETTVNNVIYSHGNKLFFEKIKNKEDSLSYAFGIVNYNAMKTDSLKPNPLIIAKAMFDDKDDIALMSDKNARSYIMNFVNVRETKKALKKTELNKEVYKDYKSQNDEFLIANRSKAGVIETPSGLQYEVIVMGTGPKPLSNSTVTVHYVARRIDGSEFDSSVKRNQPATFPVSGVIPGWTEALQLMPVGSKFKLYLPQNLAYGATGAGDVIKPFSTLIFEVELLEIVK